MAERFEVQNTAIAGVKLITRLPIGDERGWLERSFCAQDLQAAGWGKPIAQINRTFSKQAGTIRGMHYQTPPHVEMKLVFCLRGAIFDVAVDLRQGSPTFLQHVAAELSADNRQSLLIPEGCAHGFQTMTDDVEMLYCHSAAYAADHEDIVNPLDPKIAVPWPREVTVISGRDQGKDFLDDDFAGVSL